MKTPLLVILLLAPLHPVALGCDKTETTCIAIAGKSAALHLAAKPAPQPPAPTPAAAPRAEKPRRVPGSRPPAHLFM